MLGDNSSMPEATTSAGQHTQTVHTNEEIVRLQRELAASKDATKKAEETANLYLQFVCKAMSQYPDSLQLVSDPLLEQREVLRAAFQEHGEQALERVPQDLRAEIKREIRGMCSFCKKPVWCSTSVDPNGRRGKQQTADGVWKYFHVKCNPVPSLKCYLCNQPLTGNRHCDYGKSDDGFYHIGECPKVNPTRD